MRLPFGILFICTLIFSIHLTIGQIKIINRNEIDLKFADADFELFTTKEKGVAIVRKARFMEGIKADYKIEFFDSSLEQIWFAYYDIQPGYEWIGYDYNEGYCFFISHKPNNKNLLRIDRYDISKGSSDFFEFQAATRMDYSHFYVVNNRAILAGYTNKNPVVFIYDFNEKRIISLPNVYSLESDIITLKPNEKTNTVNLLLNTQKRGWDTNIIELKVFNLEGKFIKEQKLTPKSSYYFNQATVSEFDDVQLVVGTYSDYKSSFVQGYFVANLMPNQEPEITYTPITELDNFFNYMKPSRAKRVKRKLNQRILKGKNSNFRFRVKLHEIQKEGDFFRLESEGFYKKTSSSQNYSRNRGLGFGARVTQPAPIETTSYRYSHAITLMIDEKGRIIRDFSMNIKNTETVVLDQKVLSDLDLNKATLLMVKKGEYLVEVYPFDEDTNQKQSRKEIDKTEQHKTEKEEDRSIFVHADDTEVKFNEDGIERIIPWYDDFKLSYGIQRIKYKDKEGTLKSKRVFYLNKIEVM